MRNVDEWLIIPQEAILTRADDEAPQVPAKLLNPKLTVRIFLQSFVFCKFFRHILLQLIAVYPLVEASNLFLYSFVVISKAVNRFLLLCIVFLAPSYLPIWSKCESAGKFSSNSCLTTGHLR